MATELELRQKVVATATKYLGIKEADGSHKVIIDYYNSHPPLARGYKMSYSDAWCACFVSTIGVMCNLTDIIFKEVGCGKMVALYQKAGRWVENDNYQAKPADVIFYDWQDGTNYATTDNTGAPDHVGIVVSNDGVNIKVIEGNYSNACKYRNLKVGGRYIRGYGVPDYASKATESTPSQSTTTTTVDLDKFEAMFDQSMTKRAVLEGSSWSAEARQWAIENGIIAGTGTDASGKVMYQWRAYVTREQMIVMLKRVNDLIMSQRDNQNKGK